MWVSMPQHFKEHGFFTQGAGKTYHQNLPPNFDDVLSWSDTMKYQKRTSQKCKPALTLLQANETSQLLDSHVCPEAKPDSQFLDYKAVDHCIKAMQRAVRKDKNFFVACGQVLNMAASCFKPSRNFL